MGAPKGNKYNEVWTLEDVLPILDKVIKEAKKGKYLSIQEAVMNLPFKRQMFYHLCKRFEEVGELKQELNDIIIAIINRRALEGEYNANVAKFRMNQLGEIERKEVTNNNNNFNREITKEDLERAKEALKDLEEDF